MRKAEKPCPDDLRSKAMTPIFTPENALNKSARVPELRESEHERMEKLYGHSPCDPDRQTPYSNVAAFNQRFGGDGGGMTLSKDDDDVPGCW
jgi:hypothetical protein